MSGMKVWKREEGNVNENVGSEQLAPGELRVPLVHGQTQTLYVARTCRWFAVAFTLITIVSHFCAII